MAGDASGKAAEKLSNVRATNLDELILKARRADVDFIDDVVALSIIRDLALWMRFQARRTIQNI